MHDQAATIDFMRPPRRLTITIWILCFAVIAGTASVWWEPLHDLVMYRTVTGYYDSGEIRYRTFYPRWRGNDVRRTLGWHRNGTLSVSLDSIFRRYWNDTGHLVGLYSHASSSGVICQMTMEPGPDQGSIVAQDVIIGGQVRTISSPPWLTKEQIERAVQGYWP